MAMGLAIWGGDAMVLWFRGRYPLVTAFLILMLLGNGYVSLLKMTIIPLIMVSIVSAILKMQAEAGLGKVTTMTLVILLSTTAICSIDSDYYCPGIWS